eukprot:5562152-Amphidinium_carterae.1
MTNRNENNDNINRIMRVTTATTRISHKCAFFLVRGDRCLNAQVIHPVSAMQAAHLPKIGHFPICPPLPGVPRPLLSLDSLD